MTLKKLIHTNISYFIRYYRLVATAVLITVAVIVGSLVVGDSVRTTLIKRVSERLGDTQTVIFARNSFMAEELTQAPLFAKSAKGYLLTNGFISRNGKLIPVAVWGTDDLSLVRGTTKINSALAGELGNENPAADIVLRLPASGLIPSGSLFVTENYTTSLRLAFDGVVSIEDGGNISMKNEQIIPLNIFVNRRELAETLETQNKINLILTDRTITAEEMDTAWNYRASGLLTNPMGVFTEIRSDRVFLQKEITETLCRDNDGSNRLFSYLANSIEYSGQSVPYSFVTAADRFGNEALQKDDIILSDYTAQRLHARPGDSIEISYFVSQDMKTLATEKLKLRVKSIVPLAFLQKDSTLSADFPGLSDVEKCTDWDSDLPINMSLISDEDKKYWELYRSTPKAIIAYDAVAAHWGNAYGNATALRIPESNPDLSGLRAEMFGIQVIHPRQAGLYAAKNGVDFASLFMALGFFIIVAAILLMLIPLSEMLYRRKSETDLMKALGYTRKKIIHILWRESAPVVFTSSIVGVIAGLLYTAIIMWLLGNVWKGATHTNGFSVYPGLGSILAGLGVGIGLSLGVLRWQIAASLWERKSNKPAKQSAWLSFGALALGVFIVFFVGLNRKGFADSSQIRTGTGGYSLWCESSVPVYHNMATPEGREKLSLKDLPAYTQILQCLRYGADDASCLNLNKVVNPTVLGVDMDALRASDFQIEQSIWSLDRDGAFGVMQTATDSVYPALIDATVLTWSLMMNLGDTLYYQNDRGQRVAIRLAGTLSNSIFQGNILIDRSHFAQIWPETTGSEVFLLKTDQAETENVRNLLGQALNEYGVRVTTTADRLRQFNSVTDTYLTIFLTLGGLGLLLGIMAFVIVVRKNLTMRHREINLYRTLGFTDRRIAQILNRENLRVPLAAIATGVLGSLVGSSLGFRHIGIYIWLLALCFTFAFVVCVVVFVRRSGRQAIKQNKEKR